MRLQEFRKRRAWKRKLPRPSTSPPVNRPWWGLLDVRIKNTVFLMASLAWMFDCLGQQVFIIARNPALTQLLSPGTSPEVIK